VEVVFHENSASPRVSQVGLSHLSVELGHLYMAELAAEDTDLTHYFARLAPWVSSAVLASVAAVAPGRRARVSTCLLVDDYFSTLRGPDTVVPELVAAAKANGLSIDYLARESACAESNGISLAALTEAALIADPAPGTTGARPPSHVSGWLCNGTRSTEHRRTAAMQPAKTWAPPRENGAREHSIFVDVELWKTDTGGRIWSCPFLASVWQLLRLGQLRVAGNPPVQPAAVELADLPSTWADLPGVVQLEPRAAPFAAYRTFSVLDRRFLPVEHAVQTILSQVCVEPEVAAQTHRRARGEGVPLPVEIGEVETGFLQHSVALDEA
jgi:hypothetical protein